MFVVLHVDSHGIFLRNGPFPDWQWMKMMNKKKRQTVARSTWVAGGEGTSKPKKPRKDEWYPPWRLTWNLQITHLERKIIFQTSIIMVHVNLPGCTGWMIVASLKPNSNFAPEKWMETPSSKSPNFQGIWFSGYVLVGYPKNPSFPKNFWPLKSGWAVFWGPPNTPKRHRGSFTHPLEGPWGFLGFSLIVDMYQRGNSLDFWYISSLSHMMSHGFSHPRFDHCFQVWIFSPNISGT